ncbi:MAG: histidine--tRNA ligase [Holosporales bacterium]|nr:histidine--tRNA ligase [Holosporales bacterium]
MSDHLFNEEELFDLIIGKIYGVCSKYGFRPMSTPILEKVEVFTKPLGEASDVVGKEMYIFDDKGGDTLAMRPEGTASIVRAFIEHKLFDTLPFKAMYSGPMFRYERPQKGRFRQLHQIGIESIGYDDYWSDVECISAAYASLASVGVAGNVQLEINTLGDTKSRETYRKELIDFFQKHIGRLSPISRRRLELNPLRILDSKEEQDQLLFSKAPKIRDCLTENASLFFNGVLSGLKLLGIPYVINDRMVRGLDYYVHTVFEFTTADLGAQGTVLAGGRYDNMIAMMGGPQVSAFGWAAGLERLSMLTKIQPKKRPVIAVVPVGGEAKEYAFKLADELRKSGVCVEVMRGNSVGKMLNKADKMEANYAALLGSNEIESGAVTVKNLKTGAQQSMALEKIVDLLKT